MQLNTYIGQAVKEKRINEKQTLRGLSNRAFMSYGYLSEIERGIKEPSSDMINNICNGLKITVLDLMIDVVLLMQKDSAPDFDLSKELLNGNYTAVDSLL